MNHRWFEKQDGSKTYQVCSRCAVMRMRESARVVSAITQTEPFYHYRYESRWVYFDGQRKISFRPDCPPIAPREYKMNNVVNVIEEQYV